MLTAGSAAPAERIILCCISWFRNTNSCYCWSFPTVLLNKTLSVLWLKKTSCRLHILELLADPYHTDPLGLFRWSTLRKNTTNTDHKWQLYNFWSEKEELHLSWMYLNHHNAPWKPARHDLIARLWMAVTHFTASHPSASDSSAMAGAKRSVSNVTRRVLPNPDRS